MYGNALMSSHQDQISQYNRTPEAGTPANTEGWALMEAAKRLASAIVHGNDDDKETREVRKTALRLNWRLWTIFQAELTVDGCPVPEDIRMNMLTLCKFVDKHTIGCLADPTADRMRVLIDINRNIAAGLLQIPEDEVRAQTDADSPSNDSQAPGAKLETEA